MCKRLDELFDIVIAAGTAEGLKFSQSEADYAPFCSQCTTPLSGSVRLKALTVSADNATFMVRFREICQDFGDGRYFAIVLLGNDELKTWLVSDDTHWRWQDGRLVDLDAVRAVFRLRS